MSPFPSLLLLWRPRVHARQTALALILALFVGAVHGLGQGESQRRSKAKPWEKIERVTYKPQRWDDGDSFHAVTEDGREIILRLYFVDTCEEEKVYADRIRDQAEYFGGLSDEQTKALGRTATRFTRNALEKPFTVMTRWHKALGRSQQDRWYCVVLTADGKDLGEELVRNGLARIYGTRTVLWDGRTSKEYNARLVTIEEEAKREKRGGWVVR